MYLMACIYVCVCVYYRYACPLQTILWSMYKKHLFKPEKKRFVSQYLSMVVPNVFLYKPAILDVVHSN